jgi:hypothetical protein
MRLTASMSTASDCMDESLLIAKITDGSIKNITKLSGSALKVLLQEVEMDLQGLGWRGLEKE